MKIKHWINKNYKNIIITAFLFPIIAVALVSISHVTRWYEISNAPGWALYLSVGVEIAAMSALAAIAARMGKKAYFPFIIVTLIQFIGNIFFSYSYIDVNNEMFKSWVDLVTPILQLTGVDATNLIAHKRFLSLFAGGLLPVISLSFLHMLVRFTEEDRMRDLQNSEETDDNKQETTEIIHQDEVKSPSMEELREETIKRWKDLGLLEGVNLDEEVKFPTIVRPISPIEGNVEPPVVDKNEQGINENKPISEVVNKEQIVEKWTKNGLLDGLTPMEINSPDINLLTPNEKQIVDEKSEFVSSKKEVKEEIIDIPKEVIEDLTKVKLTEGQLKDIEEYLNNIKPKNASIDDVPKPIDEEKIKIEDEEQYKIDDNFDWNQEYHSDEQEEIDNETSDILNLVTPNVVNEESKIIDEAKDIEIENTPQISDTETTTIKSKDIDDNEFNERLPYIFNGLKERLTSVLNQTDSIQEEISTEPESIVSEEPIIEHDLVEEEFKTIEDNDDFKNAENADLNNHVEEDVLKKKT